MVLFCFLSSLNVVCFTKVKLQSGCMVKVTMASNNFIRNLNKHLSLSCKKQAVDVLWWFSIARRYYSLHAENHRDHEVAPRSRHDMWKRVNPVFINKKYLQAGTVNNPGKYKKKNTRKERCRDTTNWHRQKGKTDLHTQGRAENYRTGNTRVNNTGC